MTNQPQPILTEHITDKIHGSYTQEWYCSHPAKDVTFHITRSTWTPDYTIRKIYEIRLGDTW